MIYRYLKIFQPITHDKVNCSPDHVIKGEITTGIAAGGITPGLEGGIEFPVVVRESGDGYALHVAQSAAEVDSPSGGSDWH